MPRLLLACALLLVACGGGPDEATEAPEPSGSDTALRAALPASEIVVDIDPSSLRRATLSRDGEDYRLARVDGWWEVDGRRARIGSWLGHYAPLRADGRATGMAPDSLIFRPDAQVSFLFSDGSARVVSFRRYGDSLAVVARPNGPVYRLAPSRLDALVPLAEALAP
ncbi:MAG: hypothetical protein R3181_07730 [Rubricoccaceae bacterium]|nr:hypothetical protein [Rubricoccaceae bacterium]